MKDNIEELPEEISDMIIKHNSLEVSKDALVPEKVQKDAIKYLFDLKQTEKEIIESMPYVNNFLIQQLSIPVDRMANACMFMKYVNCIKWDFNKNYHHKWDYEEALVLFEFMRHPLKDEVVESLFKKNYKEAFDTFVIDVAGVFDYLDEDDFINMNVIPKIVSNASVSDYAMMKILSSIEDEDTLKRVNMLIDLNKGKRDAYRKKKRNRKS